MTSYQIPIGFPLPADTAGYWEWEKMGAPRPVTPLMEEIGWGAVDEGFARAMDELGSPLRIVFRVFNYYLFSTAEPFELRGETGEGRTRRYRDNIARLVPELGRLWETEWLPSVLPGLDRARALDYAAMTDAQLLDALVDLRRDLVDRFAVHGRINLAFVAASEFADFYRERLEPTDLTEPFQALQGFPNRSLDAGCALWRLSRSILGNADLLRLFEESAPAEIPARLSRSVAGRAFLADFQCYLDEFGWRNDSYELDDPTWRDDPRIPLSTLRGYIARGAEGDPERRFHQAVQRREGLLAGARTRLAGDSAALARFERLYEQARCFLPITEDHNYYIDQIGLAVLRPPLLELGRRLVRHGTVADENDVFLLYLVELEAGLSGTDQRALVAHRQAEMTRWAAMLPPSSIGEPPPPDDGPADPLLEAMGHYNGLPEEPSRDPRVIIGIPAAPGTVQGRAKVVRRLDEADTIEPGDILVCEMTMPPWTPLFSTVSAVVADTGGVLSHCAILAREYGLPCVVKTTVGTAVIRDGMLLTVDGSRGIVRIDSLD